VSASGSTELAEVSRRAGTKKAKAHAKAQRRKVTAKFFFSFSLACGTAWRGGRQGRLYATLASLHECFLPGNLKSWRFLKVA